MRRDCRFRPEVREVLEQRLVLSPAVEVLPVTGGSVNVSARAVPVGGLAHAIVEQVNQLFDSFKNDYLQAQGAYFSSGTSAGTSASQFFFRFIVQRLNLLSEQLTRSFTQLPGSLTRIHGARLGGSFVLQVFLRTRITGMSSDSLRIALAGASPRSGVIPPLGSVSGGAATLYTDEALTAIETARAATLNATSFLIRGTFKNGRG